MSEFDDFLEILKDDLLDLAKDFGDDLKDEIIDDGTAFAQNAKEDLEEWNRMLANGELSQEDLEWLIEAKKDLAEMEALKQKGIAKAKIDNLRSAIIETVAGSMFKVL